MTPIDGNAFGRLREVRFEFDVGMEFDRQRVWVRVDLTGVEIDTRQGNPNAPFALYHTDLRLIARASEALKKWRELEDDTGR